MAQVSLPTVGGALETYTLGQPADLSAGGPSAFDRVAYAAAHVVADPLAAVDPWLDTAIDWDRTIAYREHLWSLGFGVAEAMDTAQRGMGLDWPTSLELIRRSLDAAGARGGTRGGALIASGCGTDHLDPADARSIDDVIAAYEHQAEAIEALGDRLIVMASRALARVAQGRADYETVYTRVIGQAKEPVILHWLGDMFDPALAGYWGSGDVAAAMDACVDIITAHADKIDGVKISLLDADAEIAMRRRLPASVRMYTGDDFNYPALIEGDDQGYSDALLGIFDPIAPVASAALAALAAGDRARYATLFEPTVPLSRHVFGAPTRFYKTGVVFLAYLNGHQDHFTMVGGQESARSTLHLAELFRLADRAGLLSDPDRAAARVAAVMAVRGAAA